MCVCVFKISTHLTSCKSTHTASIGSTSDPVGLADLRPKIPAATTLKVAVAVAVAVAEETLDLVILGGKVEDIRFIGGEEEEEGAEEEEEEEEEGVEGLFPSA